MSPTSSLQRVFVLCFAVLSAVAVVAPSARAQTHVVRSGETLGAIAEQRYGNRHYSWFIAKLNRLEDTKSIQAGQTLRVPELDKALYAEGLTREVQGELDQVMKSRYAYMKHRDDLLKAIDPGNSKGKIKVQVVVKEELGAAADALDAAAKELGRKGNRGDSPSRMQHRLEECAKNIRTLLSGKAGAKTGKLDDSIHLLIAQAFVRGIKWARGEDGDVKKTTEEEP
jgi:LysM repeat protein